MKLGIVGSRNFNDYILFKKAVLKIIEKKEIQCIISGGAKGVDTLAEKFADEHHISKIIFSVTKEDWNKYGRGAGPRRNTEIINESEFLIAFPSKYGKGTQDSIEKAKKKGIPVVILYID